MELEASCYDLIGNAAQDSKQASVYIPNLDQQIAAIKQMAQSETPTLGHVKADSVGRKDDGGKARWNLLFQGMPRALRGVVGILMFGAKKYAPHSWQNVPEGLDRYTDAINRHLMAIHELGYDSRDKESGKLHIDHLACDVLFMGELIRREFKINE